MRLSPAYRERQSGHLHHHHRRLSRTDNLIQTTPMKRLSVRMRIAIGGGLSGKRLNWLV
jgi:hypothetical protein